MINIAICDDEIHYRELIGTYITSYMNAAKIDFHLDLFSSGEEFIDLGIEIMKYQLVFLDIYMDSMDGIETAKRIREISNEMFIVFATAYMTHLSEGYFVNAIRYLLKDQNFETAIFECLDCFFEKVNYSILFTEFSSREGLRKIAHHRILYIESNLHLLSFHVMEDKLQIYSLYKTLDNIENILQDTYFIRPHKSFLVNVKYIKDIYASTLLLSNGKKINISRSRLKYVKEEFYAYKANL